MTVDLPFLHPGIMRGIISRIGREAGISALYWKYGACLYEKTTRSRALIEQRVSDRPNTWSGQIVMSTRGGQAEELLQVLQKWIKDELERSGCRDWQVREAPHSLRPTRDSKDGRPQAGRGRLDRRRAERKLEFHPPPTDKKTYCVSYAWNDESNAVVDGLCEEAGSSGASRSCATRPAWAWVRASPFHAETGSR